MKGMNRLMAVVLASALFGCAVSARINYRSPSMPEEGGIKFTRITNDEDRVRFPTITDDGSGRLVMQSREFFDISHDGSKVAYMGLKNDKGNIFIKDLTMGRGTLQRTFRDNVYDVSFSPDDKTLAFADSREGSWNIYAIGAESGSAIRQITTSTQNELYPVFNPAGRSIMFVQRENYLASKGVILERTFLWTYDLEKGSLTQYTEGDSPSFNPDGGKVALVRRNQETGFGEIWLVDLLTGQEFLILSAKGRGFMYPCLSPDGKRIALVSKTIGQGTPANFDISVVDLDGTNLVQLTFHPGHDICPRWSPDGKSIYFMSQRGTESGQWNIWRMDLQ